MPKIDIPEEAYSYLISAARENNDEVTLSALHYHRWNSGYRNYEDTNLHLLRAARASENWSLALGTYRHIPEGLVGDCCKEFFKHKGFAPKEVLTLSRLALDDLHLVDRKLPSRLLKPFLFKMASKSAGCRSYKYEFTTYFGENRRNVDWFMCCCLWGFKRKLKVTLNTRGRHKSFELILLEEGDDIRVLSTKDMSNTVWGDYPPEEIVEDMLEKFCSSVNHFSNKKYTPGEIMDIIANPVEFEFAGEEED